MSQQPLSGAARIIDRGYQHYQGVRLGPAHGFWTMFRGALQYGVGIRRPHRAKIIPMLLIVVSNIPITIFLGFQILTRTNDANIPSYVELETQTIQLFLLLFSGVVGPDMFCPDRRERVLALYFTSPITRAQYVLARISGLATLLLAITLLPMLLLFVGKALLAASTADYIGQHTHDLGHILLSGVLLAAYFAALVSLVASFSDRRAYAGGAFIGILLVSAVLFDIIANAIDFTGHEKFILADLINLGPRTVRWLFGEAPLSDTSGPAASDPLRVDGWAYLIVLIVITIGSVLLTLRRYRRIADS
jgi:ABC-2 type transport system permease protein